MKDIIETVLRHPIASVIVISVTACGIADIIRAKKGVPGEPFIRITVNKTKNVV